MGKETPNPQKGYEMIMASQDHIMIFIIGNIVAFIVALLPSKPLLECLINMVSNLGDGTVFL
jgi:undecaprenyl-diphosphatase